MPCGPHNTLGFADTCHKQKSFLHNQKNMQRILGSRRVLLFCKKEQKNFLFKYSTASGKPPQIDEDIQVLGIDLKHQDPTKSPEQLDQERTQRIAKRDAIRAEYRSKLDVIRNKQVDFDLLNDDYVLTTKNTDKKLDYASKAFFKARFKDNNPFDFFPPALVPKDLEEGFEIQKHFLRYAQETLQNYGLLKGWKVGVTTAEALKRRQMEHPFVGAILDMYQKPDKIDGTTYQYNIAYDKVLRPWLPYMECELAFDLNRDFWRLEKDQPDYTKEQVYQAVNHVIPVFEFVGARMEDGFVRRYGAPLQQADCGGNVLLVCGKPTLAKDYLALYPECSTLAEATSKQTVELLVNRKKAAQGRGIDVTLGWQDDGPLASLWWFINYVTRRGISIPRNHVMSVGTMSGKLLVQQRDKELMADFGKLGQVVIKMT